MAGAGAAGRTSPEFLKLLGFSDNKEMIASFSALLPQVASSQEYELATANGLFVDDTLSCIKAPFPLSLLPISGKLAFHPTLAKALEPNPYAADAFREWAIHMGQDWAEARRVATAHNTTMELNAGEFPEKVGAALGRISKILEKHRTVPRSAE